MVQIATDEAKTQLDDLVLRASRGETIVITEHGLPVAKLVSVNEPVHRPLNADEALATARRIRAQSKLAPGETVFDLIREGRKY